MAILGKDKEPCRCFGTDKVIGQYKPHVCRRKCRNLKSRLHPYRTENTSGSDKLSTTLKKLWK
jgi:hypothetical protein